MTFTRVSHLGNGSFASDDDLAFSAPQQGIPAAPTTQQPASDRVLARVHYGAIRSDASGQVVAPSEVVRHIEGLPNQHAGQSVAATFQNRYSGGATVQLVPGDESSRTTVSVAERMGLIRRDEGGNWVDASDNAAQAAAVAKASRADEPQPEQKNQDEASPFDQADSVAFADAIAPIPQGAFDVAQAHAIAGVLEGQTESALVAEVATRLAQNAGGGMSPDQAAEAARKGLTVYSGAVAKLAAAEGISGDRLQDFYAELRAGQSGKLQDAIQRLVYSNDMRGFRALAQAFTTAKPGPEVAALQNAGFEVARDATGGWLARMAGGNWVPVKAIMGHAGGEPSHPKAAPAAASAPAAPAAAPQGKWLGDGPYRKWYSAADLKRLQAMS